MTIKKNLKQIIRDRMAKTGEAFTAARVHVLNEQQRILGRNAAFPVPIAIDTNGKSADEHEARLDDVQLGPDMEAVHGVEAAILKLNRSSARLRILGSNEQITFRSGDFGLMVPGQVVTLSIKKRWSHRGSAYGSGNVSHPRIDVSALGLQPLGLEGVGEENTREIYGPEGSPDPELQDIWLRTTAKPRHAFEMEQVLPGADPDDFDMDPIIRASELNAAGLSEKARTILLTMLSEDLRCLDAHAHLGNFSFDHRPEIALKHYEVGVRIGEQALGPNFTGMLPWGHIDNRPFLRCLYGYGLCLWRLGRLKEAELAFERILWLNPNDNQGARFCWLDVRQGKPWRDPEERDRALLN